MSGPSAEEQLRTQVRGALADANISQAEASRQLGLSTKHMCHMLTGKATLTLDWAEKILALCGQGLLICATNPARKAPVKRAHLDDLTSDALDDLYDRLDRYWTRIVKQSNSLQEYKRDNFQLRMDVVTLLEGKSVSEIRPGEISAARRTK